MKRDKRICCGCEIEWKEPAMVRLRKMGGADTLYLTPDEAERLSEALLEAANEARRSS